jgi:hypothetical protein
LPKITTSWAAALGALVYLALSRWDLPLLIVFGFMGWLAYRIVVNRTRRLLKRFTAKVRKVPGVRMVVCQRRHVTVLVDEAVARTYGRVNALLDRMNSKWFPGEKFSVSVRDDLDGEELRALLSGSKVLLVREDLLDEKI